MANDFIDTSALVKYYHPEDGTQEVTRLLEEPPARHYVSRLSLVETVSAFAVKCRMRQIDERDQVSGGEVVWKTAAQQEYRMKELRIMVSDEEGAELEHISQALGVTLEELLKRSVAAYLPQVKAELTFEPIGFGMWADRPEMQDAAKWVADLRERQWKR